MLKKTFEKLEILKKRFKKLLFFRMASKVGIIIPPPECEIDNEHILTDTQIQEVIKFEHKNRDLKKKEKIEKKKKFIKKFTKKHKVRNVC